MKLSRRKFFKRLLLASLAATTLTWQGGAVYAEDASDHEITITDHDYTIDGNTTSYDGESSNALGGYADANSGNYLSSSINDGKSIIGGRTSNSENSSRNVIIINGGTITTEALGGFSFDKDAADNVVIINGGTVLGNLRGGDTYTGGIRRNVVIVNGGTIKNVYGGSAYYEYSSSAVVENNKIILNGGTITAEIRAGASYLGTVMNNSIDIYNRNGNLDLSSAKLYGYMDSSAHSGNTLNVYTKGITANNIYNFESLNFYLPANAQNGDVILILTDTGGTDISGATVNAGVQSGSNLKTGDSIILITNANGLTTNGTTYGTLSDGVSLNYEVIVEKSGDNAVVARIGNVTDEETTTDGSTTETSNNTSDDDNNNNDNSSIVNRNNNGGTVNGSSSNGGTSGGSDDGGGRYLRRQTEVISESAVVPTIHLVGYMSDKLVDWLPPHSFELEDEEEDSTDGVNNKIGSFDVFISGSGGSYRNKTGDGSYINSTVKGFDGGFGRTLEYASGPLVFAPIFEYATGNYDNYLPDGTHGKGSTKYFAGGLIGRKSFKSGFYVEASARFGKTERDFHSDTMTSRGMPVYTHYNKTSAPVFAGHLRIGKQMRLNKNNLLDVYGIYFHTHQDDMNIRLYENGIAGEDYHFSSANAGKVRLGYRLTTRTSKISRIYTGLAFQYEHSSAAVGTYKGRRTPGGGNHGASGMIELGWLIKPNKNNPWMLDLNATGFVGHQRGLSGTIKLQKEF